MDLGDDHLVGEPECNHVDDILIRHAAGHLLGRGQTGHQDQKESTELLQHDLLSRGADRPELSGNYSFDAGAEQAMVNEGFAILPLGIDGKQL